MKKEIEAKLAKLNENKSVVMKNLNDLKQATEKNVADLQAIAGAIQVCEQLLKEEPKEANDE